MDNTHIYNHNKNTGNAQHKQTDDTPYTKDNNNPSKQNNHN